MATEVDIRRAELLSKRRELLLQKKEQLEKTEKVFRQDTGELISAPAGLSGNEIIYRDDTENKGKEKGQFFGMQALRGAASMFASVPQVVGAEQMMAGEAYTDTYNDDFGFGDVVNSVNPFANTFSRFASQDKILEAFGVDMSSQAEKMDTYVQSGKDIVDKNKKFLDETGLSKKDSDGIFYDVGAGVGSLLTSIGLTMVTKNPVAATAFFGELQKTQFYQEARASGAEPNKARFLANTAGAFEAGLEYVGGKVFLDAVANNSAVKRILVRTVSESVQEGAQTAAEEIIADVSGVRKKSTGEILTSIGYSAALGAIISAPVNTAVDFVEKRAIEAGVEKEIARQFAESFGNVYPEIQGEVNSMVENEAKALDGVDRTEAGKVMETFLDTSGEVLHRGTKSEGQRSSTGALYFSPDKGYASKYGNVKSYVFKGKNVLDISALSGVSREGDVFNVLQEKLGTDLAEKIFSSNKINLNSAGEIDVYSIFRDVENVKLLKDAGFDAARFKQLSDGKDATTVAVINESSILPYPDTFLDGRPIDDNVAAYEAASQEDVFASLDAFVEKSDKSKPSMLADFSENTMSGIAKILEPISTTIRNVNEKLFYSLRKFEMDTKVAINTDAASLKPFLQKWKKLSKTDRQRLDIALKNTDTATQEIVAKKYGILQELRMIRPMLDNIYNQAKEAGIEVEYRSDFIPRKIKDLNGLLSFLRKQEGFSAFEIAFENKVKQKGRNLTQDEKADIVSSLLRGNKNANVSLKDSGIFDQRTIEKIGPEIDKFYQTTDQALISYIITANEGIQRNRLFGKGENVEDSNIGKEVLRLVESGEINDKQAQLLMGAFNARFNRGAMGKIVEAWKNIIYLETMGSNFGSTLRQIGDVGVAAAQYGVFNTAKGISQAVRGNSVLDLKEIGIEQVAQEFESSSYTGKVLEKTFEITGLNKMDRLGKRTLVNSAYNKLKKLAAAGDASFTKDMNTIFGAGAEKVINDFANGNISDDVKFVLFNKLLDVQPVALSEMPAMYLTSGNGRIFYTLKSFTVRQLDLYRRESISKIRKGIKNGDKALVAEGMNNGMRLLFFTVAMNVGVDYAWDFIKNLPSIIAGDDYEPPVLEDKVIDNVIKAFGLNKYGFDQMTRPYMPDTPYEVFTATVAPPAKTINNMWKDWQSLQNGKLGNPKDLQTLRSLPVGGELYYFWFGGGSEKAEKASEDSKYLVK